MAANLTLDLKVNRSPFYRFRLLLACTLVGRAIQLANWIVPSLRITGLNGAIDEIAPTFTAEISA